MSAGNRRRKKKSIAGRVCSVGGTALIVLVILLCSLLVFPGAFQFRMYNVISGSMEPELPVGSLIYVRESEPEEVEEEDIIAFFSFTEEDSIITHRVIKNNVVSGTFTTKGDANSEEDPTPVPYDNYIGKVVLKIPYLGKAMTLLTSFYGKIGLGCVVCLGAVLNVIGSRLR